MAACSMVIKGGSISAARADETAKSAAPLNPDAAKSAGNAIFSKIIARLCAKKSGKYVRRTCGEKQVLDSFTSLAEALSRAKSALSTRFLHHRTHLVIRHDYWRAEKTSVRRVSGDTAGGAGRGRGKKKSDFSRYRKTCTGRVEHARYTSRRPEALI